MADNCTGVRDRPILFSAPMVRALLDGRKTQTRRIVKPQPKPSWRVEDWNDMDSGPCVLYSRPACLDGEFSSSVRCPYGRPGDRLWVRETWRVSCGLDDLTPKQIAREYSGDMMSVRYDADGTEIRPPLLDWGKTRVSIHLPREYARITLALTDVRAERLRDISAQDCWAEGIPGSPDVNPLHEYEEIWERINGAGSWKLNPLVWALTFKRVTP